MKKFLFLAMICTSGVFFAAEPNTDNPVTAVGILCSSLCPKGNVWVQVRVKEALDTDTYTIEDSTGQILLFLPTDELEALPIKEGMYLLIYGKVDISPVRPEKNELYAEKVIIFDKDTPKK